MSVEPPPNASEKPSLPSRDEVKWAIANACWARGTSKRNMRAAMDEAVDSIFALFDKYAALSRLPRDGRLKTKKVFSRHGKMSAANTTSAARLKTLKKS